MKKPVIIYGSLLALLLLLLRILEYRYFVRDLSMEIYVGAVALLFTIFGAWIGHKIIKRKKEIIYKKPPNKINFDTIKDLGISKRELDVLHQILLGLSNQEIADSLFVSLNTIKTHISNLFGKLNVDRRTQAIKKAKELNIVE